MLEGSISIWASMNSWFTPTVLFGFLNLMIVTIFITSSLATHKHNEDQKQQQPHQLARSPSMLQRIKSINFYNYKSQEPTTNYATTPEFNTYFTTQHQQEPQQQQQTHFTPPQEQQQQQAYFTRSPSMLQRLKSINLYSYLSQESTSPSTTTTTTTTTTSTNHKIQETKTTHDSFQQTHEQEPEEEQEEEDEDEQEQEQEQTLDEIYSQLQGIHVSRSKSDTKPASGENPTKLARKMKKSASAKSVFKHFEEENIVETRRPATVREGKGKVTEDDDQVDAKADDFINKFKHQLKLQRMDSIIRYKEMITRGSGQ